MKTPMLDDYLSPQQTSSILIMKAGDSTCTLPYFSMIYLLMPFMRWILVYCTMLLFDVNPPSLNNKYQKNTNLAYRLDLKFYEAVSFTLLIRLWYSTAWLHWWIPVSSLSNSTVKKNCYILVKVTRGIACSWQFSTRQIPYNLMLHCWFKYLLKAILIKSTIN